METGAVQTDARARALQKGLLILCKPKGQRQGDEPTTACPAAAPRQSAPVRACCALPSRPGVVSTRRVARYTCGEHARGSQRCTPWGAVVRRSVRSAHSSPRPPPGLARDKLVRTGASAEAAACGAELPPTHACAHGCRPSPLEAAARSVHARRVPKHAAQRRRQRWRRTAVRLTCSLSMSMSAALSAVCTTLAPSPLVKPPTPSDRRMRTKASSASAFRQRRQRPRRLHHQASTREGERGHSCGHRVVRRAHGRGALGALPLTAVP